MVSECILINGLRVFQRRQEKEEEMKQHVPGTYAKILSQEVRLLQVLDHPNIIKLYRMIETEQDYYIIMYVLERDYHIIAYVCC